MPKTPNKVEAKKRAAVNTSSSSDISPASGNRQRRKRRRVGKGPRRTQAPDSEPNFNIKDAKEIDRRLRKVARDNSISSEDMHKVVRSVVRNDHVLALVTLKAEDELAREKREAEQRSAIIITETPSVPKLTRAKARELNCTPSITLAPLNESPAQNEIEALIREDLHSDEDDEEYTFKEDDFHSDEDTNTTASDFDSSPCTPQTPQTVIGSEDTPVKLTADGCFKLPLEKSRTANEDLRIAARTRSKLCLQQTTIEDLQSEFVPPDVDPWEIPEYDMTANDKEWMQFLNDFSKPLSNSFVGDDDDPIDDPEYVAAEKVTVDAEELRDVNISKKELTDLVSELFEGLLKEGVSLDSVELDTPHKFLMSADENLQSEPKVARQDYIDQVTRQIDFESQTTRENEILQTIRPTNIAGLQIDRFDPNVMSTPNVVNIRALPDPEHDSRDLTETRLHHPPKQSIPMPDDTNNIHFTTFEPTLNVTTQVLEDTDQISSIPYDTNFTHEYISIRNHFFSEYTERFENLRHVKPRYMVAAATKIKGFTQSQHDILQQQLRLHTQLLTQTYLQTYSHPVLYQIATKSRSLLFELHENASRDSSFNCWNLSAAIELINKWEHDLNSDECQEENKKMMEFINKEIELTDGHTRQVSRLAPRIMDLILNSKVFMYPQYLPRMAFRPKTLQQSAFAPSEYQLIAMGLEKHLLAIKTAKKPLRKGACPLRLACKRMAKDTLHGKQGRRLFDKLKELRDGDQYNPVKYYFDHECAPPIDHILLGFEDGIVKAPIDHIHELPSAWKYYIEKTWIRRRARRSKPAAKASGTASESYLQFVREAIGEDLLLPENFCQAAAPHGTTTGLSQAAQASSQESKKKKPLKSHNKWREQPSLTINVNYVLDGGSAANISGTGVSIPYQEDSYAENIVILNRTLLPVSECAALALPPPVEPLPDSELGVNFVFDQNTQTFQINDHTNSNEIQHSIEETSAKSLRKSKSLSFLKRSRYCVFKSRFTLNCKNRKAKPIKSSTSFRYNSHIVRQRTRHKLQKRCTALISSYGRYLRSQRERFAQCEAVQFWFRRIHALDRYTQLLVDLSMFCRTKVPPSSTITSPSSSNAAALQHQQQQRRQRLGATILSGNANGNTNTDDETIATGARSIRKANRQEEMLRHMLQKDSSEESNRKDATFAFNYYEKVEEALLGANRVDDCKKFNQLLRSFDPKNDKVSDLYLNVEKLLLPDNPELAEVFLNFLLPAEAAEASKFFEHFMITNATNFINKLNIYFSKQPAQIRKIYACLSELAELSNVSMKKVESKILPLLKGNQFLCDWFMHQFPQAKPPERFLPTLETVNLHEIASNVTGEFAETMSDLMETPSAQEQGQTSPPCQLRYLNGRIFYGSKIMLPAKLSFMATSIYNEHSHNEQGAGANVGACVHGIRSQGEKLLSNTAAAGDSDENDRCDEDDTGRALVIDTTCDEENSGSSIEMCDDVTLRAHAIRLNSNFYGNNCFSNTITSTPLGSSHGSGHNSHAKKMAINFGEMSPRKQGSFNNSPMSGLSPLPFGNNAQAPAHDKRKSPTKKVRSPLAQTAAKARYNLQPMVVIHEPQTISTAVSSSPAIECAKRLKTLIDQESAQEQVDSKYNITMFAKPKEIEIIVPKDEIETDEDQEFLPITTPDLNLSSSNTTFPAIFMESNASVHDLGPSRDGICTTPQNQITTQFDSDEDCKLDVVASLANCVEDEQTSTTSAEPKTKAPIAEVSGSGTVDPSGSGSAAWTREEDKIILIEMKMGARDRELLIERIGDKLKHRKISEVRGRHQFLMDFLSKLQGKM